jgi:hypothetical protein
MAKWSNEKMADLTRKLADTAIDYKKRCEELEAKLRKSALQELSALGQASEAYQAQLAAKAKLERAVEMLRILGIADAILADLKGQGDE